MHDGRQKHFGGGVVIDDGGVVIDDGGAVEVWCGYGGSRWNHAKSEKSEKNKRLERNNKKILKKYYFNKNRVLGCGRYCKMVWYK